MWLRRMQKYWLPVMAFSLLLTLIQLGWGRLYLDADTPQAVAGELNLSSYTFSDTKPISLFNQLTRTPSSDLLEDKQTPAAQATTTYRLKLELPEELSKYSIRFHRTNYITKMTVNDQTIHSSSSPGAQTTVPKSVQLTGESKTADLTMDVSCAGNGPCPIKGQVLFGKKAAMKSAVNFVLVQDLIVITLVMFYAFYSLSLYLIQKTNLALLYFTFCMLFVVLGMIVDGEGLLWRLISRFYTVGIPLELKFHYLCYVGTYSTLMLVFTQFLPFYKSKWVNFIYVCLCLMVTTLIIILPLDSEYFVLLSILFLAMILYPLVGIPVLLVKGVRAHKENLIYLLYAAASLLTNVIVGTVNYFTAYKYPSVSYPFNILICILFLTIYWLKTFWMATSDSQRLSDELLASDKQKDDFLANTSHELHNPLHNMMHIAQSIALKEQGKPDSLYINNLNDLLGIGKRMNYLLGSLLDMSLLKQKGITLHKDSVQLEAITVGVLDLLGDLSRQKDLRIEQQIPSDFPLVVADEARLVQIMYNLLHYAMKFNIQKGYITIKAISLENTARIEIADNGVGIHPELQRRLFDPYQQGSDNRYTTGGGGIGIGLTICKQLLELHGSTLNVVSAVGSGSVFSFNLPLAKAELPLEQYENNSSAPAQHQQSIHTSASDTDPLVHSLDDMLLDDSLRRPRILVVDDDMLNSKILQSMLSDTLYELHAVTSGDSALQQLDGQSWDLVISDVMMPRMSGYELTRKIRERFDISELPILLLTARSRMEDLHVGFAAGANDYVLKPVDALELNARVQALTKLHGSITNRMRMEAAWLQAQIKPHFLFNTLNTIVALSEFDLERMRELLNVFSDYLRTSLHLQGSDHLVSMEKELSLLKAYLYIEKERFEERITIKWCMEVNNLAELAIPPLTIQPLVENALRHGILKRAKGGTVSISIVDCSEYIEVSIEDDGKGIPENEVPHLLERRSQKQQGIGLVNTHRRLKPINGTGLSIASRVDEGTVVSFRLPK